MKTSKVKSVQGNGTWESQSGTMYQFIYEMEDGAKLQANHKSQEGAFEVGSEVEYEITRTHEKFGDSGRVRKPNSGSFGGSFGGGKREFDTTGVEVGHAISNGVQIAVAKHGAATELQHIESYARKILALSAKMKAEVTNAKKAQEPAPQQPAVIEEPQKEPIEEGNDLPF